MRQWPYLKPRVIVYVRCEPEVAYSRIQKRGGVEENRITLGYLRSLHELHEAWLGSEGGGDGISPVLTIDTSNVELEHMHTMGIVLGVRLKAYLR